MKARVISLIMGLVSLGQIVTAQNTSYKMNVRMTDGSFFSVAADDVEQVYFTTTAEKQFEDTYYTVSGRAEKGPFKSGSTVTLQPLDLTLNALGTPQSTMTFDDCGNYAFRNTLFKYPYVQLTATGLFFNEYDDYRTRDTQLTLQGYADLLHGSKANVNVVTHLISERVLNLVIGGVDFDVALSQAQGELLSVFGLQHLNNKDFAQVSITDGDDYAAALLAISIPLLYDRKGADLISWMTRLRYDFADDGKFTEQNMVQYKKDRNHLSFSDNIRKLVEKYKDYGMTVSVKDLRYFYDWDDDGVAGNEIYDPSQPATYDVVNINAPMEGGTYTVNVKCNVPLYASPLNYGDAYTSYNPWGGYFNANLIWHSEYNNGVWTIKVDQTNYKYVSPVDVKLYDAIGSVVATVKVSQAGNPNGTFLGNEGTYYVTEICRRIAQSHGKYKFADAKYTGLFPDNEFKAPLTPNNYNLNDLFNYPYQVINMNGQLLRMAIETNVDVFNPMCYVTNALMYYELISIFGDVPYITTQQETYGIPRTSADEIFGNLIANITSVIDKLNDVKAGYIDNADGIAIPPRDLARIVLADIYMYQGKYAHAKALLSEIVNGNRYSLVPNINNLAINCSEVIWSQPYSSGTTRAISGEATDVVVLSDNYIVKTYADVLLSLAECENKLGNDTKANEYLNQVKTAKGIETASSDVIPAISEVRSKIQIDFGGYFAFLKRTGLAKSTLGLEDYQLLFPIPQDEIYRNPSMTQNPGYNGSVTR